MDGRRRREYERLTEPDTKNMAARYGWNQHESTKVNTSQRSQLKSAKSTRVNASRRESTRVNEYNMATIRKEDKFRAKERKCWWTRSMRQQESKKVKGKYSGNNLIGDVISFITHASGMSIILPSFSLHLPHSSSVALPCYPSSPLRLPNISLRYQLFLIVANVFVQVHIGNLQIVLVAKRVKI